MRTTPLGNADVAAAGHRVGYVQDILAHDGDDSYWSALDHRERVASVTVPVSSVGGWYDIFLPGNCAIFRVLQELSRPAPPARLTVGPWHHLNGSGQGIKETLTFGLAHAREEPPAERPPVRLFVMGQDAWRTSSRGRRPGTRRGSSTSSLAVALASSVAEAGSAPDTTGMTRRTRRRRSAESACASRCRAR